MKAIWIYITFALLVASLVFPASALADGIIIPHPPPCKVRELVPHKLRERDTLGSEQKLVLNPVGCYDSNGEPELDSFGDVQSSLIVKPHPDDTARATSVMKAGLDLLKQQPVITYVEWRSQTGLEKGQFDSALSYILTYPGQWGQIAQITPGIFGPDPNATP